MADDNTLILAADRVASVLTSIFVRAGGSAIEARAIADNLVEACLTGHDSHGIARTERYVEWSAEGGVVFGQDASVITDSDAFALLDGNLGFGQTVGVQATELGLRKAREAGVAIIGLRRAGHLGRIGAFAEQACKEGFASIHFANVQNSLLVAPFGSAERHVSTAPFCVGVPQDEKNGDFILDFATSRIAEGKAMVALRGGARTPAGALIDARGIPTDDPRALYGDVGPDGVANPSAGPGALAPMGGHKGSGLALACELLAGALTGSGTGGRGKHIHNGMLSIYIAPESFGDQTGWRDIAARYLADLRGLRPAEGVDGVLAPGDPERRLRAARLRDGLPVSRGVWESILRAGERVGLEREALEQSVALRK